MKGLLLFATLAACAIAQIKGAPSGDTVTTVTKTTSSESQAPALPPLGSGGILTTVSAIVAQVLGVIGFNGKGGGILGGVIGSPQSAGVISGLIGGHYAGNNLLGRENNGRSVGDAGTGAAEAAASLEALKEPIPLDLVKAITNHLVAQIQEQVAFSEVVKAQQAVARTAEEVRIASSIAAESAATAPAATAPAATAPAATAPGAAPASSAPALTP